MADTLNKINTLKKEFGKIFFFSLAGIFLLYLILSFSITHFVIVPREVLIFAFFLTIYTGYIISKTKFDFLIIFRILLIGITIFIGYISLLLVTVTEAVFFLFVPVVLMVNFLFSFRISVFASVLFFCFHFFALPISVFFGMSLNKSFYLAYPQNLVIQENIGSFVSVYFSLLILFYTDKIFNIKKDSVDEGILTVENPEKTKIELKESEESESFTDDEKYSTIYKKIIACLEVRKVYQEADFSIRKLAEMVDSNTTYVSKALNQVGDKKFSQIINDYRINQVIIDFDNRVHYKFTIEHIYKAAGFSQQSTFNRIFKEYTGKTPSEYIENLSKSDII